MQPTSGLKEWKRFFWQIEGIASCTRCTPEQLRLPLHTAKCSQSTVHNMHMKNMVELRRGPASSTSGILTTWTRIGKTVHMSLCLNMVQTCTYMLMHLHTNMNMYVHSMYMYINICRCTYMFMHSYLCLYIVHTHA